MSKMSMALSTKLGWAEELACSAWWGGVSYSIPWWCRGHSQGNQSQTLLNSVTDTPQRTIIIKTCLHSFVLNIRKHFLTWAGHSERQHSVHPWRFFKSWTGRAMSDLPSNNPSCSSRFHQITCVRPFQATFLWFYKIWSLKWLPLLPFPHGKIQAECPEEVKPAKEFCDQPTDSETLTLMVIKMRVIYHQSYKN